MSESFRIVCANIIERNGKILLVQEGKEHVRGEWNLPAGSLEKGEDVIERAEQEAREETNLEVEPQELVGVYFPSTPEDSSDVITFVFNSEYQSGEVEVDGDEILDADWFTLERIENLNLRSSYIVESLEDWEEGDTFPIEIIR
ncbi:MAG: NUDIX domain-containing protein [Candidatus Nanohaloarchaea archaeon]|nr:NUDIX domain-containing protein [Candidatus Nanohaloarchaea archaeon]